jgi:protein involved in polysaccharide export with SLBB domain
VTVNVKGFATRVVYVMGAVNNTGKFSIPKDTRLTLLQALAEAGGFSEQADESGIRIRRYDRGSGHQRTSPRIDFDVLLQAGIDIPLRANDTIQVPKRTKLEVAIWGKGVQSPGTYAWRDGLTITRLIPMAGGLEKFADTGRVLILRREPDGQKTYRIDLDRVYANREPDFLLRPGDVVRIDDTFF